MFYTVSPFFRSPFSDLTQAAVNAQHHDACGDFELQMMECMEAYGAIQGKVKCKDIIEDFGECLTTRKQYLRSMEMRMERHKQWWNGQLKEHYEPGPKIDSY